MVQPPERLGARKRHWRRRKVKQLLLEVGQQHRRLEVGQIRGGVAVGERRRHKQQQQVGERVGRQDERGVQPQVPAQHRRVGKGERRRRRPQPLEPQPHVVHVQLLDVPRKQQQQQLQQRDRRRCHVWRVRRLHGELRPRPWRRQLAGLGAKVVQQQRQQLQVQRQLDVAQLLQRHQREQVDVVDVVGVGGGGRQQRRGHPGWRHFERRGRRRHHHRRRLGRAGRRVRLQLVFLALLLHPLFGQVLVAPQVRVGVDPEVACQLVRARKPLETARVVARVGLFAGVGADVAGLVLEPVEQLVTKVAFVGAGGGILFVFGCRLRFRGKGEWLGDANCGQRRPGELRWFTGVWCGEENCARRLPQKRRLGCVHSTHGVGRNRRGAPRCRLQQGWWPAAAKPERAEAVASRGVPVWLAPARGPRGHRLVVTAHSCILPVNNHLEIVKRNVEL